MREPPRTSATKKKENLEKDRSRWLLRSVEKGHKREVPVVA